MPDTREDRRTSDAAEQAAAGGDYASAERLLRETALQLEHALGPLHPDLANTLNNLGVVCERADKPAEAESFYRRAHAIATAALGADHPFAATSRQNLMDFCEARGLPFELPVRLPVVEPESTSPSTDSVLTSEPPTLEPLALERPPEPLALERPLEPPALVTEGHTVETPRDSASTTSLRAIVIGAGTVCVLAAVVFVVARTRFGANPAPEPATSRAPVESILTSRETAGLDGALAQAGEGRTNKAFAVASPSSPSSTIVIDAQLCGDFSTGGSTGSPGEWRCTRPSLPVEPGSLVFYTRVRSAEDTTVQHLWYSGNQLRRVVALRIRGSRSGGYRTYSRTTVDSRVASNWRVELRSNDGALIHEERFAVR
jgi:hypothetical protein